MAVKLVTFCSYHTGMPKVTSGAVKISLIALIVWLIFFHALIVVLMHILFVTLFLFVPFAGRRCQPIAAER